MPSSGHGNYAVYPRDEDNDEPHASAAALVGTRKRKHGGALTEVSKHTSKGGLHRSLGIPAGEKIGAKRIAAATHSGNPKTRRQARLAQTYAKHRPD